MPDELPTIDSRLDAALGAMRQRPDVPHDAATRVAARAVLANAPATRVTAWSVRAAAALGLVALGAAALRTAPGRPGAALVATVVPVPTPPVDAGVTITPVLATHARPILFELDAPGAQSVQVLGDFNQWSRHAGTMQRGSDGHWRTTALLPPGRYVYAYLVDGRTFRRDPLRDAVEDQDFGVNGSELVVGEAP